MIHVTNVPGLSAYNPCERRMAPLSRDLVVVVLPHDSFGSHLDKSGKTVDPELEKQNFTKAAETLVLMVTKLWLPLYHQVQDGRNHYILMNSGFMNM